MAKTAKKTGFDPKRQYTTEELKNLPQTVPKVDWNWVEVSPERQWVTSEIPGGELCTPRVTRTMTTAEKYACYRNGHFIGFEPTVELAKRRCAIGRGNELNEQVKEWERENPGALPPFLALTPREREAYRHHQLKVDAEKRTKERGSVLRETDPEAAKLRAQLQHDSSTKNGRKRVTSRGNGQWTEDMDKPIEILKAKNPKKEGSDAHARWALLLSKNWPTVSSYLSTPGSNPTTLKNAVNSKNVKVG